MAFPGQASCLAVLLAHLLVSAVAISRSKISATVLSEGSGPPSVLFGAPRNFKASRNDLTPGVHPRIVFSASEWGKIVNNYASKRTVSGSWASYFLNYVQGKGPGNPQLNIWANLDTSAYTGKQGMDPAALKELADQITKMSEYNEGGLFMYALHTAVNEATVASGYPGYLPYDQTTSAAINVIVNYAKIILSHYATYGCDGCEYKKGTLWSDLWDTNINWGLANDWYTGGLGMALSYDVLYDRMTRTQRRFVRSALALAVHNRKHWGISDVTTLYSPDAVTDPHRIFSNWATYHANLYLANLAIEGETDLDDMTSKLGVGFDSNIHTKTVSLYDAFMKHSIYPDGSSFEDGYIYSLGFREASLGFVALARRGHNFLASNRFRNFILNGASMTEPFQCGHLIGHASGGGLLYPTFYALARYTFPSGVLPAMLWRQRMGTDFRNSGACRTTWHQVMMQMAILGGDHSTTAQSPAGLTGSAARAFPLSLYATRRGLLMARSSLSESALYVHFDARPDAFFPGHDNADRGDITLSALGRTWLPSLPWRAHPTSQSHSLMHVDGQAQALKAPSVRMKVVRDLGHTVLAAADLTYAYNVQWARPWAGETPPSFDETVWTNGVPRLERVTMTRKETGNPRSFGWPSDDDGSDLGFTPSTSLWGEKSIGFRGLYTWKRDYRTVFLKHAVRSFVLVRQGGEVGYAVIGDDFAMTGNGKHKFESYLILAEGVSVLSSSGCSRNKCKISLTGGSGRQLDVHASTKGSKVSFREEQLGSNVRLVISSTNRKSEQFCIALHAHSGENGRFRMKRNGRTCILSVGGKRRKFRFNKRSHALNILGKKYRYQSR